MLGNLNDRFFDPFRFLWSSPARLTYHVERVGASQANQTIEGFFPDACLDVVQGFREERDRVG
jgi:hypothetical protein